MTKIRLASRLVSKGKFVPFMLFLFVLFFIIFLPQLVLAIQTPEESCNDATEKLMRGGRYDLEVVTNLINEGADVNAKDSSGVTPLMDMLISGAEPEVLKALIEAGADVNAKDIYGSTPLMYALLYKRSFEVITVFINAGAEVNTYDDNGFTPLYIAGMNSNSKAITALVKAGATVSFMFESKNYSVGQEVMTALAEAGVDVSFPRKARKTINTTDQKPGGRTFSLYTALLLLCFVGLSFIVVSKLK